MPTEELVLDRRIVWDASRMKEVEQAKKEIMFYKRTGHEILTVDVLGNASKPMKFFRPRLEAVIVKAKKIGGHVMKILCDKGDERVVWDKDNGTEAKQAKKKFNDLLTEGYKAYSVDIKGKKNRRIEEFDVDSEEILMIPPTARG